MKLKMTFSACAAMLLLTVAVGCNKPSTTEAPEEAGHAGHDHGAEDDSLVWHREGLEHDGFVIALGQHGEHVHAGESSEAAVMLTKDGSAVGDAKVFIALLDEAGEKVLVEEQAAIFEPQTAEEPAHYAVPVKVPGDVKHATLGYRIELPGGGVFSQKVPVNVEKH